MAIGQTMKIVSICCMLVLGLAVSASDTRARTRQDPLCLLAASIARAGEISDPGEMATILHDTIGVDLVRSADYFGRSDMAAGQTRFTLDERSALARQGLEVALLVRQQAGNNGEAVANAALGDIKAELDINDWGVVSRRSWRQVSADMGKLYTSIVLPDTPGLPSFELPGSPCCRLIITVAPRKTETEPVWFVHITQFNIRTKS
jgi:hypothetical protein